jgi:hypothetical protein
MLFTKERRIAKIVQLLLSLTHQRVEPSFHIRQLVSNMVHEDLEERQEEG